MLYEGGREDALHKTSVDLLKLALVDCPNFGGPAVVCESSSSL
jgi:hypothetical protein